jgi:hypothetical protein
LIEVASGTEFHDDVEFLPLDDGLAIGDDVDVLELFEEFDFVEYIFGLFCVFIGEFDLLDDVVFVLGEVVGQVGVAEGAAWTDVYPCPIIFKILY